MAFKILDEIGVVFGNNKVDNEYFYKQVDAEQRASLQHYYEDILGRDIRYLADETQTSLSLACDAAKKALEMNHISGQDIDMIICISHTPEYVSPTMARFVADAIDGRKDVQYFDMNQNCTGMLVAMDIADKYFRTDESMQNILIVQGDCNSRMNAESTSPLFGIMSDIGCAIILERSSQSGIKNRYFRMLPDGIDSIVYPKEGYSKPNPIIYTKPGLDPEVKVGAQIILENLSKEQLGEIKAFCVSQFALANYNQFVDMMNIPKEKVPYVGDKYGYTGASSPVLALKECLENGLIQRGDHIILWTYGAGIQHGVLEMIY